MSGQWTAIIPSWVATADNAEDAAAAVAATADEPLSVARIIVMRTECVREFAVGTYEVSA